MEDSYLLESQNDFIEIPTPDFDENYAPVRSLLFEGFIPVKINFGSTNLIVKALSPAEFRYIELICDSTEEKVPLYFLYSLVFLHGQEVIPHRKKLHDEVQQIFSALSSKTIDRLIQLLSQLQSYYTYCYANLEGYLYERESRSKWDVYQNSALNSLIEGIQGYNTAQEVWISFNKREDERERQENDFSNSKFIASAFIGSKEIKRIEQLEKLRWTEELKRRQNVRLKNKEDRIQLTKPIATAEDLVAELTRQIHGETDLHDKIIAQHEQRIAEMAEQRRIQLEAIKAGMDKDLKDAQKISGGSKSVSQEELQEQIQRMNEVQFYFNEESDRYLSKIEQTRVVKPVAEPPETQAPLSIFDPKVQEELEKLERLVKK